MDRKWARDTDSVCLGLGFHNYEGDPGFQAPGISAHVARLGKSDRQNQMRRVSLQKGITHGWRVLNGGL